MKQRDLLKDQIEQLGKVLAKILSDFLGLKAQGETYQGMEITSERLQSELDIEIEKLITLTILETKDYLKNRMFTAEHLDILSEYLRVTGIGEIESNKRDSKLRLEKAIELLNIADEFSKTMSLNRVIKKNEIKDVLEQYL